MLRRQGLNRLSNFDKVTLQIVRYERDRPGKLIHIDVKKLARSPNGGGWRVHGRSEEVRDRGNGYDYLHIAVDDASRVAYIEVHPDEQATVAGHLAGTLGFFDQLGVTVERVMTDNALTGRRRDVLSGALAWACVLQIVRGVLSCPSDRRPVYFSGSLGWVRSVAVDDQPIGAEFDER